MRIAKSTRVRNKRVCGIAGEFSFSGIPSSANWPHISALMKRRGPDGEGSWSAADGHCTLVFRRLAIIDLSHAGDQPMLTDDGRHALVFNGEIYNFRTLRKELEQRGVRFRSTSDSEVVLQALVAWGPDALKRFNGIFAIGFYDSVNRRLLLARDHAGIKPLYVLRSRNGVVFGSQYDQLIAHPWSAGCSPSADALGLYLRFAFVPAPYGILQNTEMLEPGSWLEVDSSRREERRGRHFTMPRAGVASLTGEAAVDAVDEAVGAAVRRQMISDVPVAAFLSGGIDSPLVVSKMRGSGADGIHAFTIGTADPRSDESSDAAAYAQELQVIHHLERVTADRAETLVSDAVDACGEPFGDYSIIPTSLVSQIAARDFKVVLSGDGGDELFWGYVRRVIPMIQSAGDFATPYPLRAANWHARRVFGATKGRDHLRWPTLGDMQVAKHTHLPGGWLERVFPGVPALPDGYTDFEFRGSDADSAAHWLRWNEFVTHLTMVLLKVDRASMFHSLEVRVPLLDKEVIETALKVDWQSCIDTKTGMGKLPLRRALARVVRHESSAKRGFEVPMGEWLRTSLRALFEDTVLARDQVLGVPIDRSALRKLFDQHLSRQYDFAWGLWPILSLALWEQRYLHDRVAPLDHLRPAPSRTFD